MPKRTKSTRRRERRLRIREDLRREPDVRKIANTVIALAMAQAEKDAQDNVTPAASDQEPRDA